MRYDRIKKMKLNIIEYINYGQTYIRIQYFAHRVNIETLSKWKLLGFIIIDNK